MVITWLLNLQQRGIAKVKYRLLAAGIHFLFSAAILSLLLAVVYFIWYPHPYHTVQSVFDVVKLLIGVDLVLGPLLMFVIFNLSKPRRELVRDVSIIVLFQVSALLWGGHITYKMRPLFAVFQEASFHMVVRQDINIEKLSDDVSLPAIWQKPKLIYVEPLSGDEKVQQIVGMLSGEVKDVMFQAERYRPFSNYLDNVLAQALDSSKIVQEPDNKTHINSLLDEYGGAMDEYALYPVVSGFFSSVIVFNRNNFSPLEVVDLKL